MAIAKLETCRISDLVYVLQTLMEEHGDVPVFAMDADTRTPRPIGVVHKSQTTGYPARLEINSTWAGQPNGFIKRMEEVV